jgi:predicted SAM-dependent methyltransferase
MIKLNLGCGNDHKKGWINLDKKQLDLNKTPYNWNTNETDEILLANVYEHIIDRIAMIHELHRILKPKGKLTIITPYYTTPNAMTHPQHYVTSHYGSMELFNNLFKIKTTVKVCGIKIKNRIIKWAITFTPLAYLLMPTEVTFTMTKK